MYYMNLYISFSQFIFVCVYDYTVLTRVPEIFGTQFGKYYFVNIKVLFS